MSERISNIIMVVAVACGLVTTSIVVRREFRSDATVIPGQGSQVRDWARVSSGRYWQGPDDAPIVIVEFFDFQCPACRRLSYTLDTIMAQRISQVRIVRRHFPLGTLHARAYELAIAGECAGQLGKFKDFYRSAFDNQGAVKRGAVDVLGLLPAGIDTSQFRSCLQDPASSTGVSTDVAVGNELGIRGTPTLVINGRIYVGARTVASLDSLLSMHH